LGASSGPNNFVIVPGIDEESGGDNSSRAEKLGVTAVEKAGFTSKASIYFSMANASPVVISAALLPSHTISPTT
jgi:hypothetical protein